MNVVIVGAAGRMGRQVVSDALRDPDIQIVGAVDAREAPCIGEDVGILSGNPPAGVKLESSLEDTIDKADAVIEFTNASATAEHIKTVRQHRKAYVIGTTGLDAETVHAINAAASQIPILLSPNMSVGINLIASILPAVVKALQEGYDAEIVESHHRYKQDAPSGTALMLAEIIEKALGKPEPCRRVYGRKGIAPRVPGELGIHSIRAGGNFGEHHLIFANEAEEIILAHRAFSRQTFSLGALRAVKFLVNQPPGLYDMQDVLSPSRRGKR